MTAGTARPRLHYAWVVLGASTLILLASSGVRSSFGVFIKPLEAEFGWGRTSLSVVASLSLFLYGAMGPLVGRLADRWGPRGVLIGAVGLLGIGAIFFSHQIGAATGAMVGGFLYDRFGNYTLAFHTAAVLAFAATAMVLAIRERPEMGRPEQPAGPLVPATVPGA